jgi:hypothetical protein
MAIKGGQSGCHCLAHIRTFQTSSEDMQSIGLIKAAGHEGSFTPLKPRAAKSRYNTGLTKSVQSLLQVPLWMFSKRLPCLCRISQPMAFLQPKEMESAA